MSGNAARIPVRFSNGNIGEMVSLMPGRVYRPKISCRAQLISLGTSVEGDNENRQVRVAFVDPMQPQLPEMSVMLCSPDDGVHIAPFANVFISSATTIAVVIENCGTLGKEPNGITPKAVVDHGTSDIYKLLPGEEIRGFRAGVCRPENPSINLDSRQLP